jgi:hypothetical protein
MTPDAEEAHAPLILKMCCCGRAYTLVAWEKLESRGFQSFDDGEILELRNYACGSTIAFQVQSPREP